MVKSAKPVIISCGLVCLGLVFTFASCKSTNNDSEEKGLFDSKEQKLINEQIKSFDDTKQKLKDANKNGAKGCDKLNIVWDKITETQQDESTMKIAKGNPGEIVAFGNGSAERFWRIFRGFDDGSEIRPYETGLNKKYVRLTHRYASYAKMKFVVKADVVKKLGYTGQYAEGNDCVLGRLSSAVPTEVADRFTPAMATKFFVDGDHESQVLIVQHDIGGQSSGMDMTVSPPRKKEINNNFYLHYLSNRLSFENGVPSGTGAFSRFYYTTQFFAKKLLGTTELLDPRELQASHLADLTKDGKKVGAPKGPRFIWMGAPTAAQKAEFQAMADKDRDFRKHFFALNKKGAATGLPLFNVYASDKWTYNPEKDATLIGQMVTTSQFAVSEAADVRLFFKHPQPKTLFPKLQAKNAPNEYPQDYPVGEWGDGLFTTECRLGVKEKEIQPKNEDDLNGNFIQSAIFSKEDMRRSKDGKPCLVDIIESKLEETFAPKAQFLLP